MSDGDSDKMQERSAANEDDVSPGFRYWATTTVSVLLAILMLQFAVLFVKTEPYPAFIFPGFANVPFSGSTAQVRDVQIQLTTNRGDVHDLPYNQLFHSVPRVHAYLLTIRLFSPGSILGWEPVNRVEGASSSTSSRDTSSTEVYVLTQDQEVLDTRWLPRWHEGRSTVQLRNQLRDYLHAHPALDSLSTPDKLRVQWKQQVFNQQGFVREYVKTEYHIALRSK